MVLTIVDSFMQDVLSRMILLSKAAVEVSELLSKGLYFLQKMLRFRSVATLHIASSEQFISLDNSLDF